MSSRVNPQFLPKEENPSIDIRNLLAQYSANVLWNDYKLIYDPNNEEHRIFADALQKNDLLRLFKSAEETLSKEGWCFLYWDIWDKNEMGEEFKSIELQLLPWFNVAACWYENLKIYAAIVYRNITFGNSSFPIVVNQMIYPSEIDTFVSTSDVSSTIPFGWKAIPKPAFYERYKTGTRKTNYKDVNVEALFNRDFNFFSGNYNEAEIEFMNGQVAKVPTFQHLMDAWNVRYYEQDINSYLDFIYKERGRNATRWIFAGGSAQENNKQSMLLNELSRIHHDEYLALMSMKNNARLFQTNFNRLVAKYKLQNTNILEGDYIQISGDKTNTLIDKMQSDYDLTHLLEGVEKQMKLYCEGSGYNYNVSITEGSYNNVTAVQSHNQLTLQTTKAKKSLREKAINSMLFKIYGAWCNYDETKMKEFGDNFKFEIVCNVINDQYKNPNVILAAVQNSVKSKKQAIIDLNPTWSEEQVDNELIEILSDIKTSNELNFGAEQEFANQDNENSKEMNNVGDNPTKSKVGDNV